MSFGSGVYHFHCTSSVVSHCYSSTDKQTDMLIHHTVVNCQAILSALEQMEELTHLGLLKCKRKIREKRNHSLAIESA